MSNSINEWVKVIKELYFLQEDFRSRRLKYMEKWSLDIINGISDELKKEIEFEKISQHFSNSNYSPEFLLSQLYFDNNDYLSSFHTLSKINSEKKTKEEFFLQIYSLFLV
jgi:hypothetical protein